MCPGQTVFASESHGDPLSPPHSRSARRARVATPLPACIAEPPGSEQSPSLHRASQAEDAILELGRQAPYAQMT